MRSVASRMAIRTRTVNWVIGINTTTIIIIVITIIIMIVFVLIIIIIVHITIICAVLGRRGNKKADNELGKKQAFD